MALRARTLIVLTLLLSTQPAVWARGGTTRDIPGALVVDPCRGYSDPAEPDRHQTSEVTLIDFLGGAEPLVEELGWTPSHPNPQRGATFASLPGYAQSHLFVTHGDRLDVFEVDRAFGGYLDFTKIRSVGIGALLGIADLELGRVAAGRYVPVEAFPGALFQQASLYLIGTYAGGTKVHYAVVDQQWLIEGSAVTSTVVYDHGPICLIPSDCEATAALDVRVGDVGNIEFTEEVYFTTVERFDTIDLQLTFRLERGLGIDDFSLTPRFGSSWQSASSPIDPPLMPNASGIRFAEGSSDLYVPRKREWTVRNIVDGTESCQLPGEPTDVAVWEPGIDNAVPRYLLATTWDGSIGRLDVFPSGPCGAGSALSIQVGAQPVSLDVYESRDDALWVLVVSEGARLFEAIHLDLDSAHGSDTFTVMETRSYDMLFAPLDDSCPSFVQAVMREETAAVCPIPPGEGGCSGLDRKCLRNDPRCD